MVAKRGLGHGTYEQIAQHFAKGGPVKMTDGGDPGEAEAAQWSSAHPSEIKPLMNFLPTANYDGASSQLPIGPQFDEVASARQPAIQPEPTPPRPAPATPAVRPEAQPAPMLVPSGGPSGGGDLERDIRKQSDREDAAVRAQAVIRQKQFRAEAELRQKQNDEMAKAAQASQDWQNMALKGMAEMAEKTKNGTIDPDHYWQNHSRISAGIAMILGGLGSGMAGGPNQALQVIQGGIDRDIDAQKANLEKNKTIFGQYMQMGHSAQESTLLADAHSKAIYAGQLEKQAAEFGDPMALAAAQELSAKLKMGAAEKIAAVRQSSLASFGTRLENQLKGYAVQQAQQNARLAPLARAVQMQVAKGVPQGESARPLMNQPLIIKTAVGLREANNDKDAEEMRSAQEGASALQSLVNEAREFRAQHGRVSSFNRQATHQGEAMMARFKEIMPQFLEHTRAPGAVELKSSIGDLLSDPSSFFTNTGTINTQLDELQKWIDSRISAAESVRLKGGGGMGGGVDFKKAGG